MERCAYDSIKINNEKENGVKKWTPLARQVFVCTGLWTLYFSPGLAMGVPPVYIAQTRKQANSTEAVSTEMASWLTSAFGFASLPWVIILPFVAQKFGRKITIYIVSISAITNHTLLYCSTTTMQVFISEIITGINLAAHTTVMMQIIAEYTSPRYRGVFLTLKSASMYWGIWVGNAVASFSHWRYVGLLGSGCCMFCGTSLFWPESPYWLASKQRYRECREAHYWLKGFGKQSKEELEMMINGNRKSYNDDMKADVKGFRNLFSIIFNEEFYKPMLLVLALFLLTFWSGKLVCNMYVLEIVKEVTASESAAYMTMLVIDGVTVFGMYMGCMLSKFFKRRSLLLTSASIGILFLYAISLYLYLINHKMIVENKTVLLLLIATFSLFISIGPIILLSSICAEIAPLKWNPLTGCMVGLFDKLTFGIILKISPFLFKILGLDGSFLFFASFSTILVLILYKYLPETKDKTLQEIAETFKTNKSNEIELMSYVT